ncbi:hypothetical protein FRC00_001684 [Tulasnella sp. 408]|nr:hypothetical protein FRC00_001684 [Tulasnella sp. 408]
MAATPQHIYQFANILKRRTSSDEELYTKIKDMMVFADERSDGLQFDRLQFERTDAGNPVWFAVRSSDLIGLLLDIAANGEKNEGTFTRGTALNHARAIAIWRLGQFVSRLDFKLYANKDLTVDLIQRVPRILKIYENAIQGQDRPGEAAPTRLPLLFIVGSLAELDTLKTIDKSFSLLRCNLETMAWLVFTPFFSDRKLSFDTKGGFDVECGGNIIRSYYDVGINSLPGSWMKRFRDSASRESFSSQFGCAR